MGTCASIKSLSNLKLDCDPQLIRKIWKARDTETVLQLVPHLDKARPLAFRYWNTTPLWEAQRAAIDLVAGFHGVEYLGEHRRAGGSVYYCNAGDTYAGTICFHNGRLFVSCWGDLIERKTVREVR